MNDVGQDKRSASIQILENIEKSRATAPETIPVVAKPSPTTRPSLSRILVFAAVPKQIAMSPRDKGHAAADTDTNDTNQHGSDGLCIRFRWRRGCCWFNTRFHVVAGGKILGWDGSNQNYLFRLWFLAGRIGSSRQWRGADFD